jgi:hypothetical protein
VESISSRLVGAPGSQILTLRGNNHDSHDSNDGCTSRRQLTTEVKILSGEVNERRRRNTNKGGALLVRNTASAGKRAGFSLKPQLVAA